ncbi:MAG: phage tail tube protein, partial [candidate division WOR-3 bacterium]
GSAGSGGIGDFLASIYGDETGSIPESGKYLHVFSLLESAFPPWFNLWSDKDAVSKQVVGFRCGSLKFTIDGKEGQIPVEVEGISKSESNLSSQTLTFSDKQIVIPSNATTVKLGGSTVDLESIEITIEREQEGINTVGTSRDISTLISGKTFKISFALSGLAFSNETERTKFKNVGSSSLELKIEDDAGWYLHFDFPEIYYTAFEGPSISDTDVLRVSLNGMVTGEDHSISLLNDYQYKYTDGTLIS